MIRFYSRRISVITSPYLRAPCVGQMWAQSQEFCGCWEFWAFWGPSGSLQHLLQNFLSLWDESCCLLSFPVVLMAFKTSREQNLFSPYLCPPPGPLWLKFGDFFGGSCCYTEGFKELLSWVLSSFRARFHGKLIPYEKNPNPGAAFGMSRTLGAFPGGEDAAELLRGRTKPRSWQRRKGQNQEWVWRGPRSCCPLQLNWKRLDMMQ